MHFREILQSKIFLITVLLTAVFILVQQTTTDEVGSTLEVSVAMCADLPQEAERIDCWMGIIEDTFKERGTQAAFDDFIYIYERYTDFADTGCHKHAHRVGDLAFYYDFLSHKDLSQVEFPKNATSCGYGFYHGFIEHLVQNTPTATFVDETCPYLKSLVGSEAPALSQTCFHGAGHGFVIAQADQLLDPADWTIEAFTKDPLQKCDALTAASDYERNECYLGVYTVLTEWMSDDEFGLSYNESDPYKHCNVLVNPEHQAGCYQETSQKFDYITNYNLEETVALVNTGLRDDLRVKILEIALSGYVQRDTDSDGEALMVSCRKALPGESDICVRAILGGLIEHGPFLTQYPKVNAFCSNEVLSSVEQAECKEAYARKLYRYNSSAEIGEYCELSILPEDVCSLALSLE